MHFQRIFMTSLLLVMYSSGWAAASIHLPFTGQPSVINTGWMAVDSPRIAGFWERSDHPLDLAFQKCAGVEGAGDYTIRLCLLSSLTDWEKELMRSYDALMYTLAPTSASAKQLKRTQKQWERFRKTEFAWIETKYNGLNGTMYQKWITIEQLMIVRERALLLSDYRARIAADTE